MGDLPTAPSRKLRTLSVRLTLADRHYIRRIARIRRVPMTTIVAEMIEAHRAKQLEVLAELAQPVARAA